MRRPEVNDAIRLPPSLKPETRPNKPAAASGATAARLTTRGRRFRPSRLGKSDDLAAIVDVDPDGVGLRRQARHGAHFSADRVDEAGADRRPNFAHWQLPALGGALELGVRRDREVRFGNAHAELAEAVALERVELLVRRRVILESVGPVDLGRDGLDLLAECRLQR